MVSTKVENLDFLPLIWCKPSNQVHLFHYRRWRTRSVLSAAGMWAGSFCVASGGRQWCTCSHATQQQAVLVIRLLALALSPWPCWNRRAQKLFPLLSLKQSQSLYSYHMDHMVSVYSTEVRITIHLPTACIVSQHLLFFPFFNLFSFLCFLWLLFRAKWG